MLMNRLFQKKNAEASANKLAFFNILGPVILNGINFFTIPLFTHLLGKENFGVVSLYTTWMQVLTVVMGVQTAGTVATARVHIPEEERDRYYSSVLFLSCLSSAGVCALVALLFRPISAFTGFNGTVITLLLAHSFGASMITFATTKLIQNKQAVANFAVSVLASVSSVALALLLVYRARTDAELYTGRMIGYAAPNFILGTALLCLFFVRGKTGFHRDYWRFCLPLCLPLVLHSLSQIALSHADIVMIRSLLADDGAVGVYSAAFNVAHVINIIYLALNNTWVPLYYDHMKKGDTEAVDRHSRNYMALFTVLAMGFMLLSPEVYGVLIRDASFAEGRVLLPVMTMSFYLIFLYSFPVNYEFYHKKSGMIAVGTCSAAVVNIIANYFLIKAFGVMGAAVATMLSYAALFAFHHVIAGRLIKGGNYHFRLRRFLPGLAAVGACMAVCYLLDGVWIARWGIGAALGAYLIYRVVIRQKSIF